MPDEPSATLLDAVRLLDERNHGDLQLPAPSIEFILYETARLLEAIAGSMQRSPALPRDIREHALRFARHVQRYIDTYLPAPPPAAKHPQTIKPPDNGSSQIHDDRGGPGPEQ